MVSTFVLIYGQRKLWLTTITESGRKRAGGRYREWGAREQGQHRFIDC